MSMNITCRSCGQSCGELPRFYIATDPCGYECRACYRDRIFRDCDEDEDDLPDTDLCYGDDPDLNINPDDAQEYR